MILANTIGCLAFVLIILWSCIAICIFCIIITLKFKSVLIAFSSGFFLSVFSFFLLGNAFTHPAGKPGGSVELLARSERPRIPTETQRCLVVIALRHGIAFACYRDVPTVGPPRLCELPSSKR